MLMSCHSQPGIEMKVLQLNTWGQGTAVEGGGDGLIEVTNQTDADFVLMCELWSDKEFISSLINGLKARGKTYYADGQYTTVGILSKYEPVASETFYPTEEKSRPIVKAIFEIGEKRVAVYSAHLDHRNYECYLPRGYSGATWEKIDAPVTDPAIVLEANRVALRDEAIANFIVEAQESTDNGTIIILGGDFNEPSHLDWQEDTKELYDHHGAVINWDCSMMLKEAGYIDTYREFYPSAVTHPGFTFPAGNKDVSLSKLAWAPEADERDRIDFIYYYPTKGIQLKEAALVGPTQTVAYGKFVESDSKDAIITPSAVWPTDHKGTLAVFNIK